MIWPGLLGVQDAGLVSSGEVGGFSLLSRELGLSLGFRMLASSLMEWPEVLARIQGLGEEGHLKLCWVSMGAVGTVNQGLRCLHNLW